MSRRHPRKSAPPRKPSRATRATLPRGARPASTAAAGNAARRPERLSGKRAGPEEPDEGPLAWFLEQAEATYTRLEARDAAGPVAAGAGGPGAPAAAPARRSRTSFRSTLQPGSDERVLGQPAATFWLDRLAEYKRRKGAAAAARAAAIGPAAPFVPGARNWLPLGPRVVLQGQTVGEEPVGGRVAGIAIVPGGERLYVASACGGVFRSDDGGASWRSLMDGFDVDPTHFASASLACGAIAIDPAAPDRVYVGTGEGDTHTLFRARVINALPAYRGIGPIRTDDGGDSWVSEDTDPGSPALAGEAFFALAVDPQNRENVVAATTAGLYQRVVTPSGTPAWVRRRPGVHSSVVVTIHSGATRFLAAEWGVGVFQSADGQTWSSLGTGFPPSDVGRIAIGVQATSAAVVYALVARDSNGALHGVYRLGALSGGWVRIAAPPDVLPLNQGSSQGAYDLAIAVDPSLATRVYLGGSYADMSPFPGSVWRADVQPSGSGFRFTGAASIGTHAHADVHVLVHTPGDSHELWCGCDGGVFLNRNPTGTGEFSGQNAGLSCLCSNFIAQHPTDPAILFTGLQDNGTARTAGGPIWSHVNFGDGGYCLINWADPSRVLSFVNGRVFRSTTGGATHNSWSPVWNFGWATMTQPIVGLPVNPAVPADANVVAVGAGDMIFVSTNFATSWPSSGVIQLPGGAATGSVFALAFASRDRLYIGTTAGRVFRADRSAGVWTTTRLDAVAAGPLGVTGVITDVAVDWTDATLASVYLCFGGVGERRRVWHFDGTVWRARSGPAIGDNLLDVEHNALAVDPVAPANVYVGADIGVWHSPDRGATWQPMQNGLPDAPVFDLQIHPAQRLLRAATHGRGVYEIALD